MDEIIKSIEWQKPDIAYIERNMAALPIEFLIERCLQEMTYHSILTKYDEKICESEQFQIELKKEAQAQLKKEIERKLDQLETVKGFLK